MRSRAQLGFLAAALLALLPLARAADPAPSPTPPIPSLTLRDGRVLHNVRIMSTQPSSIIVHADEGLIGIARANLPPGLVPTTPDQATDLTGPQTIMVPFNPNDAPMQDQEQQKPAPKVTPVLKVPAAPKPTDVNPVFKGCTIVSFQMKAFGTAQGCAEVVIRNDTESPVLIVPRDIVCLTSKGQRRGGRFMVTDGFPPQIKRREFVPSQGQIDDIVTFTDAALEISAVQWAR
ncbi:MAG TPA: hypothetical protein VIJ19_07580 [Opitutaceae bacterium]